MTGPVLSAERRITLAPGGWLTLFWLVQGFDEAKAVLSHFNLFSHPHFIITFPKECLDKKLKAMESQASQLSVLRGIKQQIAGRVMDRGAMAGGEGVYGEAFMMSNFYPAFVNLEKMQ